MKKYRKDTQKGRSMVEMMGYMAVVLTVLSAVGNLVSHVYDEFRYSKASMQVSDLAAAIVRAASADPDYSDVISQANATGSALIPKSYRTVGSKIFHAFGGQVEVTTLEEDASKFAIKFNNLNKKQCIELAMKDWQNNQTVDLFEIYVNNNIWYWDAYDNKHYNEINSGTVGGPFAFPMKRSLLAGTKNKSAQCKEKGNLIIWIFN